MPTSDVAARAQVLVQKVVIAIDIGLGGGGSFLPWVAASTLACVPRLSSLLSSWRIVPAGLAGGQRPGARISAITAAVFCTAGKGRQRPCKHDHPKRFASASGHASLLRSHRVAPLAATNHKGAANSTG